MKKYMRLIAIAAAVLLLIGAISAFSFASRATDTPPVLSIDKHSLSFRSSVVIKFAVTIKNVDP